MTEHLATGAAIALYARLRYRGGKQPPWLPRAVRWWHSRLCRALDLSLEIEGRPAPRCLLVANHISWLDIPVIGAQGPIDFLSKADVRQWPLIGWLADTAGTRFIERGASRIEGVRDGLRRDAAQGRVLAIFPEGTTTDGSHLRHFHPRLFGLALDCGLGLQPVAVSYRDGLSGARDELVPYVGDDTLIANLWRLVRHPRLLARVHFLPPIPTTHGARRRELSEEAHDAISRSLGLAGPIATGKVRASRGSAPRGRAVEATGPLLALESEPACPQP